MSRFWPDGVPIVVTTDDLRPWLGGNRRFAVINRKSFSAIGTRQEADVLVLDTLTRRNLELVESLADGGKSATLLGVLQGMGGRTMATWAPAKSR